MPTQNLFAVCRCLRMPSRWIFLKHPVCARISGRAGECCSWSSWKAPGAKRTQHVFPVPKNVVRFSQHLFTPVAQLISIHEPHPVSSGAPCICPEWHLCCLCGQNMPLRRLAKIVQKKDLCATKTLGKLICGSLKRLCAWAFHFCVSLTLHFTFGRTFSFVGGAIFTPIVPSSAFSTVQVYRSWPYL